MIDGELYIKKELVSQKVEDENNYPYVMIRTYSAGVHFGYLKKRESTLAGIEVTLINAQRMRQWSGAMDLSQLATEGSKNIKECKPSVIIPEIDLIAIEIIPITAIAKENFKSMTIWKS